MQNIYLIFFLSLCVGTNLIDSSLSQEEKLKEKEDKKRQQMFQKIQKLISDAFLGKSEAELVKRYNLIVKNNQELDVYCNPLRILQAITKK